MYCLLCGIDKDVHELPTCYKEAKRLGTLEYLHDSVGKKRQHYWVEKEEVNPVFGVGEIEV